MLAKTTCPNCGEIIEDDCLACITGGTLMHACGKDNEPEVYDAEWEIINTEGIELTKKEFEALYLIYLTQYNNSKLLSEETDLFSEESENLIYQLQNKMLISVEERENKIYSSQLTNLGKAIFDSPEWEEYKSELGY